MLDITTAKPKSQYDKMLKGKRMMVIQLFVGFES